jgi:Sigma-70, region 4
VTNHGHRQQEGSRVVTGRMLEQLTYAQIGERLNISSEGARAIVKRNTACRARTATMAEPWLRSTSTSCGTNSCPHGHHAASQ